MLRNRALAALAGLVAVSLVIVGAPLVPVFPGADAAPPPGGVPVPPAVGNLNPAIGVAVKQYAAKFVCLEPLQPGQVFIGPTAPVVKEATDVLIHNPQASTVIFYKKAVRAAIEGAPTIPPGAWNREILEADRAMKVDCDEIARLLTGSPSATFIGTFGIGVEVVGFVVVAIGPQSPTGGDPTPPDLDVRADYVRGSETFKKDIAYQSWWWWWWWPLPWRLGYSYERFIPIPSTGNIDCRGILYNELMSDVRAQVRDPLEQQHSIAALQRGSEIDYATQHGHGDLSGSHALVAMVGGCKKLSLTTASVDYVLFSTDAPTDDDPRKVATRDGPEATAIIRYPWWIGRWYDLAMVMPNNHNVDLDGHIRNWQADAWLRAGAPASAVSLAMPYYVPWWCGWGYWWWWWNGQDCIDIGVGEGESLDVETIPHTAVRYPKWPPS